MKIIPEDKGVLAVYHATVARDAYPFTTDGDAELSAGLDRALVQLAVSETEGNQSDAQRDAETIAAYIMGLPLSPMTKASLDNVEAALFISQRTNDYLLAISLRREDVTQALVDANSTYFETQKQERRLSVLGM